MCVRVPSLTGDFSIYFTLHFLPALDGILSSVVSILHIKKNVLIIPSIKRETFGLEGCCRVGNLAQALQVEDSA